MSIKISRSQISRDWENLTKWVVETYHNIEVWDYAYCFGEDPVRLIGHTDRPVWDRRR
ncbi:MAG: hypothetical protein MJY72_08810 [Bacteroidales bacterium]|nr:hypothetical protein [Bacteroidales bacterium]